MINKPIIVSLIINVVFFLVSLILSSIVHNGFYLFLLSSIVLFSFTFYVGFSHVKTFKEEISQKNKIKISLYYFIFWFSLILSVIIMMTMNTEIKGLSVFAYTPRQISILSTVILQIFIFFAMSSTLIYYAITFGCKFGLKNIETKD